jgi:hypothetical protein
MRHQVSTSRGWSKHRFAIITNNWA